MIRTQGLRRFDEQVGPAKGMRRVLPMGVLLMLLLAPAASACETEVARLIDGKRPHQKVSAPPRMRPFVRRRPSQSLAKKPRAGCFGAS